MPSFPSSSRAPVSIPTVQNIISSRERAKLGGSSIASVSYLLSGVSAAGDDGDSADLEELHLVRLWVVGICWVEDFVVKNRDREFDAKFGVCGLALWGKRVTS